VDVNYPWSGGIAIAWFMQIQHLWYCAWWCWTCHKYIGYLLLWIFHRIIKL